MTSLITATSIATALGAWFIARNAIHILQLVWIYTKPSTFYRYVHSTSGKPPWALVTGATGGIGGELAHELAQRGFSVVLHGRSDEKLRALKRKFEEAYPHRSFRTLLIDIGEAAALGNKAGLEKKISAAIKDINLTVVINNAGGTTDRTLTTLENHSSERVLYDVSVNAVFPLQLIHQTLPILERNAPGLIINIGSLGEGGLLLAGSYAASKLFLARLSEVVDAESELTNRRVDVLCVKLANVTGTGQSMSGPNLFAPDAKTMARAVLARVGCGSPVVVGYWAHAVQEEAAKLLPALLMRKFFLNLAREMQAEQSKGK